MEVKKVSKGFKSNPYFYLYLVAVMFIAIGFIDYPILAFHLSQTSLIRPIYIPLLYALAMGIDAIAAVFFGYYFDKKGIISLMISVIFGSLIAPVFFLIDGVYGILFGIVLWGIAMGAQESVLKAVIASLVSKDKRATAYGIFYTVFGLAWFLGSLMIGYLYDVNLLLLVIFSSTFEVLAFIT
jgi:MFS family permease